MYNAKYHEDSEELDDYLFQDFVEHSKIFEYVKRNRQYSDIDYVGVDKKGRKCSIELKQRPFQSEKYDTTFIEPEKMWKLINKYEQYGMQPLYINFFIDKVLIFDLKKYKQPNLDLDYKMHTITNHGYDEKQNVWRVELPNIDAIKFERDNNGEYKIVNGRTFK